MIGLRRLAMVGLACLALSGTAVAVTGCSTMDAVFGSPSAQTATTVAAAENAYTTGANLATLYLKSGKASKATAAAIASADAQVYKDLVAARVAVANGNNPAIAAALAQFNVDMPLFSASIPATGS